MPGGSWKPPGPPGGPPRPRPPPAALFLEALVHVVREDVHAALLVEIDVVVAGARPVPVGVHQCHVECQELQRAVDIQQRRQLGLEPVGWRFVQDLEHRISRRHDCSVSRDLMS